MTMPYALNQKIKRLLHLLEVNYGDYAKYTETLDDLHTLIINDAQSFKPKRTYKKKKVEPKVDPFPDDRYDAMDGGQE